MPEDTTVVPEPTKREVNLNKPSKTITISRTKLIVIIILILIWLILEGIGTYFLGQSSKKEEIVAQKQAKEEKKEEIPDLITAELGEEVKAKNGIAIELEEAKHDAAYEKTKDENRKYYEKNASQSAYLDSEYFKQSSLVLKISLKNTTDKVAYYSPTSLRLKDSKDNQYTSGYGYEGGVQATTSTLNPSETTKLTVTYIVPTSEEDFSLVYENVVIEFSI